MKQKVLLLFIFCYCSLQSQTLSLLDSIKYLNAYNFIIKDNGYKKMNVSCNLTGTCFNFFNEEFKEITSNQESDIDFLLKIHNLDNENQSNGFVLMCFDKMFIKNEKTYHTLFFSRIVGDYLFADIVQNKFINTPFGETIYYYFIFDEYGNIQQSFKKKMYGL